MRESIAVYYDPSLFDLKARLDELAQRQDLPYRYMRGRSTIAAELLKERLAELAGETSAEHNGGPAQRG